MSSQSVLVKLNVRDIDKQRKWLHEGITGARFHFIHRECLLFSAGPNDTHDYSSACSCEHIIALNFIHPGM